MRVIPFEGQNLRVWSAEELEHVQNVDADAGEFVEGSGGIAVARNGSPVLKWAPSCHPPASRAAAFVRSEHHKGPRVMVVRCGVCNRPVLAVEVK